MIREINARYKKRYAIAIALSVAASLLSILLALMLGHYGYIGPKEIGKILLNQLGASYEISRSYANIVSYIRLPRTLASFLVGGALSVAGLVYQNTFNNKLVSPDILGVSAGACVGAGLAILLGLTGTFISVFAFGFGALSVLIALTLPKFFKNNSNFLLVLSGIIVGAFMNSIIGLIKYLADRDDKLAAITFWMMGSVSGTTMSKVLKALPLVVLPCLLLYYIGNRVDIVSLGKEEAQSLGIHYTRNRLVIIICSTILTATSVSLSGNVGWVGLVIPHIARVFSGERTKDALPLSFFFGGCFLVLTDLLSRILQKDEVPLSIITGIFGAVIYSFVLAKRGRSIND